MSDSESKTRSVAGSTAASLIDRGAFRQYRAPRGNGQSLVEPSFDRAGQLLQQNLDRLRSHGEPFFALRRAARKELVEAAVRYTAVYRDVDWVNWHQDTPIIMAGHQPALFHPGVWFKNFALSRLAEQTGAIAVNLIVDNDVASGSSIRVPTLDPATGFASYQVVAYDEAGGGVPYEQTTIRDLEKFDHFAEEVARTMRPLVADPCVTQLWKHAQAAIARCGVAGCALAQARHGLEGELGLRTLELPLGVICRTPAFTELVISILDELPRFQNCYNFAAVQYRKAHRIRSSAHPVPDLAKDEQWYEAPLWIYGDDSPVRRAAWVSRDGDQLLISDRAGCQLTLDSRYPKLAAAQLASHASPNFKLRPRALLTTMYARLVLSDLFLHGIGGGKYDQLGDMIIRQFFGIEPPEFMVISATVQLPGFDDRGQGSQWQAEQTRLKRAIRDTLFQGERFFDQAKLSERDIQHKRRLLAEIPPTGSRLQWQRELEAVNQRLAGQLEPLRSRLRMELDRVQRQQASGAWLSSREHPFCLFPLDYLTEIYQDLLSATNQNLSDQ